MFPILLGTYFSTTRNTSLFIYFGPKQNAIRKLNRGLLLEYRMCSVFSNHRGDRKIDTLVPDFRFLTLQEAGGSVV